MAEGEAVRRVEAAASPVTISGLTNGSAYRFSVTALNAAGRSEPSALSGEVTPTAPASGGGYWNGGFPIDVPDEEPGEEASVEPAPEGAGAVVAEASAERIAEALAAGSALELETDRAAVTIPAGVLGEWAGDDGEALTLRVEMLEPDSLPASMRAGSAARPLVALTLQRGDEVFHPGDGQSVEVRIPYTLRAGEQPQHIVVYSIGEDGNWHIEKQADYDPAIRGVRLETDRPGSYAIVHNPVRFDDLSRVPWAQAAIETLAARGIIQGKGQGAFDPQSQVTRAEFVQMLVGMLDLPAGQPVELAFPDVAPDSWYADAVQAAVSSGIIRGRDDGTFGVSAPITRVEMAIMLQRALQLPDGSAQPAFADLADQTEEGRRAVASAGNAGLMDGYPDGSFEPRGQATRAEAATVMHRALQIR
ncbi:S-layer homology domain-containing protein [Paenibacillus sp. 1P07SE]|uniref:S-layer homology domain-containing protein n=1 Tax=Paenibacillus sp. 1P07SE TaxID=3132209 RepID=UPI0039A40E17